MLVLHHQHATEDDRATCEQVQQQEEELRILKGGPCPHCGCSGHSPVEEAAVEPLAAPVVEEAAPEVEELTDAVEELTEEVEDATAPEGETPEDTQEPASVEELDVSDSGDSETPVDAEPSSTPVSESSESRSRPPFGRR